MALILLLVPTACSGVRQAGLRAAFGVDRLELVSTDSMAPAIQKGDQVGVINSYGRVERGDLVLYRPPPSAAATAFFLKRVIALPGETIGMKDGRVTINSAPLAEPYLAPGTDTENIVTLTLGPHQFYVLGDNRVDSEDSRVLGPVAANEIAGVAIKIVRPKDRAGKIPGSPR